MTDVLAPIVLALVLLGGPIWLAYDRLLDHRLRVHQVRADAEVRVAQALHPDLRQNHDTPA